VFWNNETEMKKKKIGLTISSSVAKLMFADVKLMFGGS
jgi:hypothetical protein